MSNKPDITSSQTILHTPLFDIVEDTLVLPNGETRARKNVYRQPTVEIFPITSKYEIYLISQYRYLFKRRLLEAVAGFIKPGETSLAGAKRELQEEVGITGGHWEEFFRFQHSASVIKSQTHLLLTKELVLGKPNREVDEDIEIVKMSLGEAVEKVFSGEITTSGTIIGILMLDRLKRLKRL